MSYKYYIRRVSGSLDVHKAVEKWCHNTDGEYFYNDYKGFIKLLQDLSVKFPKEMIAYDLAFEESIERHQRVYANAGRTQVVRAEFPPCSFAPVTMLWKTINVVVLGREVPITIEVPENWNDDQCYVEAKRQLKELL